jgi:uncharacterized protein YecT (DUF1311 family)
MRTASRLVLVIPLVLAAAAQGEEARDPIDVIWDDCATGGEGPNAEQMLACHMSAAAAWSEAAEVAYQTLLARLKPPARDLLIAAQADWTRYRDAELALWRGQAEGSGDLNAEINSRHAEAELARARALYLRKFGDYFWMD